MVDLEKELKKLKKRAVELNYTFDTREYFRVITRINKIKSMLDKKTKYPSYLGVQKKFI